MHKTTSPDGQPLIYLDYNATTPVDPRVLEQMLPYFTQHYGNAASRYHAFGREAAWAVNGQDIRDTDGTVTSHVDGARDTIAAALNATPREIVFTSGATESINLAMKGVMAANHAKGTHLITCSTEHKAVLDTADYLSDHGCRVTTLPVDATGQIDLDQLLSEISDDTVLVSIMAANNEIGTLQPIREIGKICRDRGVYFHTDATQAFGKVPIDVEDMCIDLLSCSAHKLYGPKGVGALYVRSRNPRVACEAIIHGGGHERRMRSGTINVPGVVGFAAATQLCIDTMQQEQTQMAELRNTLENTILAGLDHVQVNGNRDARLAGVTNLAFGYVEGEGIMLGMPEVAVSSGSACSSASLEPSYVLAAIGLDKMFAHGSIRFSLGRYTTAEQIDHVGQRVIQVVTRLREMSPLYEMVKDGIDPATIAWDNDHHH